MVAVTYGTTRVATAAKAAAKPSKGIFARILDGIEAAQIRRAEREIARYYHLLPLDHELRDGALVPHREDELPFGR